MLKRLAFLLPLILLLLTATANAEQVQLSAQTIPWNFSTSGTAYLSWELDQDGIDAEGVPHIRGTGPKITLPAPVYNSTKGYYEVTIPAFYIESTTDWIRPNSARYNAFFIVAGKRIPWTDFQNTAVPPVFANPSFPLVGTFSLLSTFNKNFAPIVAHDSYTKQEIDRRFANIDITTSGTVTSVGLSVPTALFNSSVTNSPVTLTGTLTPTLATQSANRVFAGPGTGSAATPTFRALVAADVPSLTASQISNFNAAADARIAAASLNDLGDVTITSAASVDGLFWNGSAWVNLPISVGLSTPSWLTVAGSPVTRTGTLALTATAQSANTVLAGPTSGGSVASAFRALVAGDIPTLTASKISDFDAQVYADVVNGTGLSKAAVGGTVVLGLTNPGGTGTWTKVTVDATGRVSSGTTLAASDINEVMALSGLSDVAITSPSSTQVLTYNGSSWVNGAAPVTSAFGRTGAVAATSGDYTAAQVTNAASVIASNSFSALNLFDFSNGSDFSSGDSALYHPNQVLPTRSAVATKGTYAVDGSGNIFQLSSMVQTTGSRPTVALFGDAVAKGTKVTALTASQGWGSNVAGYADVDSTYYAVGIGTEVNYGSLGTSANQSAFGVVIGAVGDADTPAATNEAYIQMQVSTPDANNARAVNGINFVNAVNSSFANVSPVTGALINSMGITANYGWDMTSGAYLYGIDMAASTFSQAAIRLPNNQNGLAFQDAANSSSFSGVKIDSSDYLHIGDSAIVSTHGIEQMQFDLKSNANLVHLTPTAFTIATADTSLKHVLVTGTAPALGTWGVGAGTTTPGTSSVTGSDTAGKITFTTTAVPVAGDIVTASFNVAFANAPFVIIQPATASDAAATVAVSSITTGGFVLTASSTALSATTSYTFYYHVIGK